MPFNLAEARLSTIKELQKQLKKWKKYCGKAEDRLDKQMKLNEDLQEEIKKLKEVKYPVTFQKTYKIQQEEIKKLKEQLEDVKEEYWEKGWHTGKCDTFDEIDETVKPLKEEIKKLKEENEELHHDFDLLESSLHTCPWIKEGEEAKKLKEENQRMSRFLESREIKYCEKCREYNEETEGFGFNGVFQDSQGEWICDDCHEN